MIDDAAVAEPVGLNPFEAGFFDNPYDQYRRIRESGPVQRTSFGPVLITRWDDVHQLLRDPTTSVEDRNAADGGRRAELREQYPDRPERGDKGILMIDPPDHTRLRKLVSKAFTPRTVERLRPKVQAMVDSILDGLDGRDGPVDLVSELAFPLPFAVISELLGMPDGDTDRLRAWSHTITMSLDPILAETHRDAIFEASDRMVEVVTAAIEWKRSRDDDDLLGGLIRAEDDGDVLTEEELLDNVILLYLAGHETTVNLIGNGVHALLRNRAQLESLQADPALDANAVEELLRYDSPVQFSRRIALQPLEVAGHRIEPGEFVMTGLGAANRDPAKFGPDADELDLTRPSAREHVSFGSGVHHCLGAALARLEAQVAVGSLVRRFPRLELGGEPVHNGRIILRGYDVLPISLTG